jgi:hypothetical protein
MSGEENLTRRAPLSTSAAAGRHAIIGGVLLISALPFAYAGGWFTRGRLTPSRLVEALSDRDGNPLGHRRTLTYSRTADRQKFMIDGRVCGIVLAYSEKTALRSESCRGV